METTPDDKDHEFAQDRPFPRRLRTPAKLARLGVRNRRHEYLVKTPSYFDNLDNELAGMISHLIFLIPPIVRPTGQSEREREREREA